jgi:hypothetical protein
MRMTILRESTKQSSPYTVIRDRFDVYESVPIRSSQKRTKNRIAMRHSLASCFRPLVFVQPFAPPGNGLSRLLCGLLSWLNRCVLPIRAYGLRFAFALTILSSRLRYDPRASMRCWLRESAGEMAFAATWFVLY